MDQSYQLAGMNDPSTYLSWGWLSISVPNLIVIVAMVVLFVLAIAAAIPERPGPVMTDDRRRGHRAPSQRHSRRRVTDVDLTATAAPGWRSCRRRSCCRTGNPPTSRPGSTCSGCSPSRRSWSSSSQGLALAFAGPAWYHTSSLGHFTNSLHFWSVQLFFVFMVIHLWGKFWMAAWRGRRALTWITGVVAFLASIGTAFTGYLMQTNFDSQWISFEAKDGLNAVGIGAFFNVTNLGQVLLLHACLLPLVVGAIVVLARPAGPPPRCRAAHRRRPGVEAGRQHPIRRSDDDHGTPGRAPTSPSRSGRARGGGTTSSKRASSLSLSSAS